MPVRRLIVAAAAVLLVACGAPVAPTAQSPATPPAAVTASMPTRAAAEQATRNPVPATADTRAAISYPLTLTDDRGRAVTIPSRPDRIVTLAPNLTEILYALGRGDLHVAGSDFDDYPEAAKNKPKLGGLQMSAESVIGQRPDLVLAIGGSSATLIQQIEAAGIPVLVTDAQNFDATYASIRLVGRSIGASAAAEQIIEKMQREVAAITSKVESASSHPRVFHELDASDPAKLYTVGPGSFVDEIISLAGGQNIAAAAPIQYPALSAEEIVSANPQVITFTDVLAGVTPEVIAARPGWGQIDAVRTGRVYALDESPLSRPGPRLVDGLREMARAIHPDRFN